jgi:hypothetical protein
MALIDAKGEIAVRQHYYHQTIYWEFGEGPPRYRTGQAARGVGFTNLLGAMWLQMFWLLTAMEVRFCRYPECSNVIAYEQPEQTVAPGLKKNDRSKGYKTRVDKQYCEDLHRLQHWRMRKKQQR